MGLTNFTWHSKRWQVLKCWSLARECPNSRLHKLQVRDCTSLLCSARASWVVKTHSQPSSWQHFISSCFAIKMHVLKIWGLTRNLSGNYAYTDSHPIVRHIPSNVLSRFRSAGGPVLQLPTAIATFATCTWIFTRKISIHDRIGNRVEWEHLTDEHIPGNAVTDERPWSADPWQGHRRKQDHTLYKPHPLAWPTLFRLQCRQGSSTSHCWSLPWRQLYKNRFSRKIDSPRLFSRE